MMPGLENTAISLTDNKDGEAGEQMLELTSNKGVDLVIEAIDLPVEVCSGLCF